MTFTVFCSTLKKILTYTLRRTIAGWKNFVFGQFFLLPGALPHPPKVVALFASDNSMLAARSQVEDTQDGFCLLLYRSDRRGQQRSSWQRFSLSRSF